MLFKRTLFIALMVLLGYGAFGPDEAQAQSSSCKATTAAPTYVTGTLNPLSCDLSGTLRTSAGGGGGGGTSSNFGSAFPTAGTAVGALDSTGLLMSPFNLDAAGFLKVNVAAGGVAGGTSSTFGASFPVTGTAIGFSDGTNMVSARVTANTVWVGGNVASGAADSGNPVKTGGVYLTTAPTLTTGQRGDTQLGPTGETLANPRALSTPFADGSANTNTTLAGVDVTGVSAVLKLATFNYWFNGTTWDRARSDTGVTGAALTVPMPSATASVGITPVVSAALESNHVIKASAGNLYGAKITTGATPGWLLVANSTTAPTAGGAAIAPLSCTLVAANQSLGVVFNPPMTLSTGITLVFSTSGCLTNTASSTAFFEGSAK